MERAAGVPIARLNLPEPTPCQKGLTACEDGTLSVTTQCFSLDEGNSDLITERLDLDDACSVTSFRSTSTRLSAMYDNELINGQLTSLVRAIRDATNQRKSLGGTVLKESVAEDDDSDEKSDEDADDDTDDADAASHCQSCHSPTAACTRAECKQTTERCEYLQDMVDRLEVENMMLYARIEKLERSRCSEPNAECELADDGPKVTREGSMTSEGTAEVMQRIGSTRQARKKLRSDRAQRRSVEVTQATAATLDVVSCETFMGRLVDTIEAIQSAALMSPPLSPCRSSSPKEEAESSLLAEETSDNIGTSLDELRSAIGGFFSSLGVSTTTDAEAITAAGSGETPPRRNRRRTKLMLEAGTGDQAWI